MVRVAIGFGMICYLLLLSGCGVYNAVVDERPVTMIATDTKIKGIILKNLIADNDVKALDLKASCYNGHAYLIGEYERQDQKERAIAIAENVEGVKDVTPYLVQKKRTNNCGTMENTAISLSVKSALVNDTEIWSTNIDIKTIQCQTVVLWGLVGTQKEIEKAIAHAKTVEGVKKVKSLLRATQI